MAIGSKTPDNRLDTRRNERIENWDINQPQKQDRKFTLAEEILASSPEFTGVSGKISIESYVIYSIVNIELTYTETDERLQFTAKLWGIGLNTCESFASGLAVVPERLLGECICIMKLGASADGTAHLTFWRDDYGAIGQLNVTATGETSSDFGGSGIWNWA